MNQPDRAQQEQEEFAAIIDRLREFCEARGWGSDHTPINLAVSIAVETGELLEHFQREQPPSRPLIAGELADVLIYALNLADVLDIDPVKAVNEKITVNELRFPLPGETRPVGGV